MRINRCITRHVYNLKLHVEELRPLKTLKAPPPRVFPLYLGDGTHFNAVYVFQM